MRAVGAALLVAGAVTIVVIAACDDTYDGPQSACSTGEPYGPDTRFASTSALALCSCPRGGVVTGPVNGYFCQCEGGAWRCAISLAGASGCMCPDAGADR